MGRAQNRSTRENCSIERVVVGSFQARVSAFKLISPCTFMNTFPTKADVFLFVCELSVLLKNHSSSFEVKVIVSSFNVVMAAIFS